MAIDSPKNDFVEKHRWLTYADEVDTVYDGSKIIDGSITTEKLADYAVTTDKIDDESITLSKLDADVLNLVEDNVKAFDTVADMQAAMLAVGDICHTSGFHTSGDGGAAFYKVSVSGTISDIGTIALDGGLFAVCISDEIPTAQYVYNKERKSAFMYMLQDNDDLSDYVPSIIANAAINSVIIPVGSFVVSQTIEIPTSKTLVLQGEYSVFSEDKTIVKPTGNSIAMFELKSKSAFIGGKIDFENTQNTTAFIINCHSAGVENVSISGTEIIGARETNQNFTQTGVYVECDNLDVTESGYLVYADFDLKIQEIGYAYHFHRQSATGAEVFLTSNYIHGYIRHCTRYVWFDFASGSYACNGSIIDATMQSGSLMSGETNYPAINLLGNGILVLGKLWDFDIDHQHPGVLLEASSANCYVSFDTSITDETTENGGVSLNSSFNYLSSVTRFQKCPITINTASSTLITDFTGYAYRIGYILYVDCLFKMTGNITAATNIFDINTEALLDLAFGNIITGTGATAGSVYLTNTGNPKHIVAASQITYSTGWKRLSLTARYNTIQNIAI